MTISTMMTNLRTDLVGAEIEQRREERAAQVQNARSYRECGHSVPQVAGIMGVSASTVRRWLARGLDR